jgi:hypothetical protein
VESLVELVEEWTVQRLSATGACDTTEVRDQVTWHDCVYQGFQLELTDVAFVQSLRAFLRRHIPQRNGVAIQRACDSQPDSLAICAWSCMVLTPFMYRGHRHRT